MVRSPGVVQIGCGKRLGAIGFGIKGRGEREEASVTEYSDGGAQSKFEELLHEFDDSEDMVQSWHEIHGYSVLHRRRKPSDNDEESLFEPGWAGYEWVVRVDRIVLAADTRDLMHECLGPDTLSLGDLARHVGADWQPDWTAPLVILRDASSEVSRFKPWAYGKPASFRGTVRAVVFAIHRHGDRCTMQWRARTDNPTEFGKGLRSFVVGGSDSDHPRWKHSIDRGVMTLTVNVALHEVREGDSWESGPLAGLEVNYWMAALMTYGVVIVV